MTKEYNQKNMSIFERLMFKIGWVSRSRIHDTDTPEQIVSAFKEAVHQQDMLEIATKLAKDVFPNKAVVALSPGGQPDAVTLEFADGTKGQVDGELWLKYAEAG